MNRIDKTFKKLKQENRKALVAFITAGDPDFETSFQILKAACEAGVDILELGVPFSDPTSDGPVIEAGSARALKSGMSLTKTFELAAQLRQAVDTPIVLFSYYNLLFKYGLDKLVRQMTDVGIDGLLVVDLPPEEGGALQKELSETDIHIIRLAAPTTTHERLKMLVDGAGGFLYLITRTGVTGAGGLDYNAIEKHTAEVKALCPLPVCLGFGISTAEDAAKLAPMADGLIVGSAFVRIIAAADDKSQMPELIAKKVKELRSGMDAQGLKVK